MRKYLNFLPLFLTTALLESMAEVPPKVFVELHTHSEATMTPVMTYNIAKKNGVSVPTNTFDFQKTERYKDFSIFANGYNGLCSVLKESDDMGAILLDYARRSAQQGRKYFEMMFCPSLIEAQMPTIQWQDALTSVNTAAHKAEELYGIIATPLITFLRGDTAEQCEKYVQYLLEHAKDTTDTFGGIHMSGDEAGKPDLTNYINAYDIAHKGGLGCAVHAGENGGPENIMAATALPGVTRIGHGIACIEDGTCMQKLIDNNILLEISTTSNVCMQVRNVTDYRNHPLPIIVEHKVPCNIFNSDDPTLYLTSPENELRLVQENYNLPPQIYMQSDIDGMKHAFLPPSRELHRTEIIAAIQAYYEKEKEEPSQPKQKGWGSWNFWK